MHTLKYLAKREVKSKKKTPLDRRWRGWTKKDPNWFLFPLGSPMNNELYYEVIPDICWKPGISQRCLLSLSFSLHPY